MDPVLEIVSLTKSFGTRVLLRDLCLSVFPGEILGLAGQSGSGKSSLFSIVCGFMGFDKGRILVSGKDVSGLPPFRRQVGLVLQEYSLFPHMSVEANLRFGVAVDRNASIGSDDNLETLARKFRIASLLKRRPDTLSGGEKQRVAVVRGILAAPKVLLLDEPLGNLDSRTKRELLPEIRSYLKEASQAAVYVSHDLQELFGISDRIAVLEQGTIVQAGTAIELYARPKNEFVARFIEGGNVLAVGGKAATDLNGIRSDSGIPAGGPRDRQSDGYLAVIRPEWLSDVRGDGWDPLGQSELLDQVYVGGRYRIEVRLPDGQQAYFYRSSRLDERQVAMYYDPSAVVKLQEERCHD